MAKRGSRSLAALFASLALVGNLHAADIFLRCEGVFQDGKITTSIFKIDPDSNKWFDWSVSDHRWLDRECNYEWKATRGWDRTWRKCEFPPNKMRHQDGKYASGEGVYLMTNIDRLSGRWLLERHEEGPKKYLISQVTVGECAPTKDPALGPPPKAKF